MAREDGLIPDENGICPGEFFEPISGYLTEPDDMRNPQIITNRIPNREITYVCQKVYERSYYLITLSIGSDFTGPGMEFAYPQAHAVMDDFGTLRITRGFR